MGGLPGSYAKSISNFLIISHPSFCEVCSNLQSYQQWMKISLSLCLRQPLLPAVFLILATLLGVRWNSKITAICFFLNTFKDIPCPSLFLLLEFRSWAHFLLSCFSLTQIYLSGLHTHTYTHTMTNNTNYMCICVYIFMLNNNHWADILLVKILFPSLYISSSLNWLFPLSFYEVPLLTLIPEPFPQLNLVSLFSSSRFQYFRFLFRYLIHLNSIFVQSNRSGSNISLQHVDI